MFLFSLWRFSETLLILRRTERHTITNGCWSSCTVLVILPDYNETWGAYVDRVSKKILIYKILWKSVQWDFSRSTRKDKHVDGNRRFSQFCERTEKGSYPMPVSIFSPKFLYGFQYDFTLVIHVQSYRTKRIISYR